MVVAKLTFLLSYHLLLAMQVRVCSFLQVTTVSDSIVNNGRAINIEGRIQTITCMSDFSHTSVEVSHCYIVQLAGKEKVHRGFFTDPPFPSPLFHLGDTFYSSTSPIDSFFWIRQLQTLFQDLSMFVNCVRS